MEVSVNRKAFTEEATPLNFFTFCQDLQNKGALNRKDRIEMYTPQNPNEEEFDEFDIWDAKRRSTIAAGDLKALAELDTDGPPGPVPLVQMHPDLQKALGGQEEG